MIGRLTTLVQIPLRLIALMLTLALSTAAEPAPPASGESAAASDASKGESSDSGNYRIRAGDTLEMKVYQEDDLNGRVRVDEEGGVVFPLIGRVNLKGLSVESARRLISEKYEADYLHHPQVSLMVAEFAPRRFAVMGQVSKPGVYEIPSRERVNLLQAIAMAGGYTKIADPSKVRIRRVGEKGEEVLKYNAKALAAGGSGEVPLIQGDDNITVGESAF